MDDPDIPQDPDFALPSLKNNPLGAGPRPHPTLGGGGSHMVGGNSALSNNGPIGRNSGAAHNNFSTSRNTRKEAARVSISDSDFDF